MPTEEPAGGPTRDAEASDPEVTVDAAEAFAANRANWDDRADIHVRHYDLAAFDDPAYLSAVVRADAAVLRRFVPDGALDGLALVHLQCHLGTDTISWARLGAVVTGVDLSGRSLAHARDLAARHGHDVRFVEANVVDAADVLAERFDVVYTSIGTIVWLPDLAAWGRSIAGLLAPGGVFLIRDGHPMMAALDETLSDRLEVRHRYFADGRALRFDDGATYVGDERTASAVAYEWPHPLSEILMALIAAGLRVELVDEGRDLPWPALAMMERSGEDWVLPARLADRVPLTYTILARAPGRR